MNVRLILSGAAFTAAMACGFGAGAAQASTPMAPSSACWSGYHPDRHGDCQSDNPVLDTRCQDGFLAQTANNSNGYRCVPIPPGY